MAYMECLGLLLVSLLLRTKRPCFDEAPHGGSSTGVYCGSNGWLLWTGGLLDYTLECSDGCDVHSFGKRKNRSTGNA